MSLQLFPLVPWALDIWVLLAKVKLGFVENLELWYHVRLYNLSSIHMGSVSLLYVHVLLIIIYYSRKRFIHQFYQFISTNGLKGKTHICCHPSLVHFVYPSVLLSPTAKISKNLIPQYFCPHSFFKLFLKPLKKPKKVPFVWLCFPLPLGLMKYIF